MWQYISGCADVQILAHALFFSHAMSTIWQKCPAVYRRVLPGPGYWLHQCFDLGGQHRTPGTKDAWGDEAFPWLGATWVFFHTQTWFCGERVRLIWSKGVTPFWNRYFTGSGRCSQLEIFAKANPYGPKFEWRMGNPTASLWKPLLWKSW